MTTTKSKIHPSLEGLPKTIRIGVNTYKLILEANLRHPDGSEPHGWCDVFTKELKFNSNGQANMTEVVLHEILHALWYEQGLRDFRRLSEEQTVNGISIMLTSILMNNPKLRTYFNKQWSK